MKVKKSWQREDILDRGTELRAKKNFTALSLEQKVVNHLHSGSPGPFNVGKKSEDRKVG